MSPRSKRASNTCASSTTENRTLNQHAQVILSHLCLFCHSISHGWTVCNLNITLQTIPNSFHSMLFKNLSIFALKNVQEFYLQFPWKVRGVWIKDRLAEMEYLGQHVQDRPKGLLPWCKAPWLRGFQRFKDFWEWNKNTFTVLNEWSLIFNLVPHSPTRESIHFTSCPNPSRFYLYISIKFSVNLLSPVVLEKYCPSFSHKLFNPDICLVNVLWTVSIVFTFFFK